MDVVRDFGDVNLQRVRRFGLETHQGDFAPLEQPASNTRLEFYHHHRSLRRSFDPQVPGERIHFLQRKSHLHDHERCGSLVPADLAQCCLLGNHLALRTSVDTAFALDKCLRGPES